MAHVGPHDDSDGLSDLPNDVLERICRCLEVPQLIAMERTCKRFQLILANDLVWSGQSLGEHERAIIDSRLSKDRVTRCIHNTLSLVERSQASAENFLVEAFHGKLPCQSWRVILDAIVRRVLPDFLGEHHFYFRGDSLATILELLQSFLRVSFQRALRVRLARSEGNGAYPIVNQEDLKEQEAISSMADDRVAFHYGLFRKNYAEHDVAYADSLMEQNRRDKLLRLIAFQAGIPRLDNDVYQMAWTSTVEFARTLVFHVCVQLCERVPLDPTPTYGRHGMDLPAFVMQRHPPPPVLLIHATPTYLHTPAPQQFEDVVKEYFPHLPNRVYCFWLSDNLANGKSAEEQDLQESDLAALDYASGDDSNVEFNSDEYSSDEESDSSTSIWEVGDSGVAVHCCQVDGNDERVSRNDDEATLDDEFGVHRGPGESMDADSGADQDDVVAEVDAEYELLAVDGGSDEEFNDRGEEGGGDQVDPDSNNEMVHVECNDSGRLTSKDDPQKLSSKTKGVVLTEMATLFCRCLFTRKASHSCDERELD